MVKSKPRPAKIHDDQIPWLTADSAPTKVRIRRLVTRERHGSDLLLGVCEWNRGSVPIAGHPRP